jgi:hypothetical protein
MLFRMWREEYFHFRSWKVATALGRFRLVSEHSVPVIFVVSELKLLCFSVTLILSHAYFISVVILQDKRHFASKTKLPSPRIKIQYLPKRKEQHWTFETCPLIPQLAGYILPATQSSRGIREVKEHLLTLFPVKAEKERRSNFENISCLFAKKYVTLVSRFVKICWKQRQSHIDYELHFFKLFVFLTVYFLLHVVFRQIHR